MTLQRFLPFLLSVLMLLSQQSAAVHALSHWQEESQHSGQPEQHQGPEHACERCLAYAALGSALPSQTLVVANAREQIQIEAEKFTSASAQAILAYISRAPPLLFV